MAWFWPMLDELVNAFYPQISQISQI